MVFGWGASDTNRIMHDHGDWLALAHDEAIEFAATTMRDLLIFTDRRVIITSTEGLIRRKREYLSVPYRGLSRWSVESRRSLFDGAELRLWVASQAEPIVNLELQRDKSAREVMQLLSRHAL